MNLIKNVIAFTLFLAISGSAFSQATIEFRPSAAYTIQETVPVNYGNVRIYASETYGFALAVIVQKQLDINFSFQTQPTSMDVNTADIYGKPNSDKNVAIKVNSYLLGFNKNVKLPNEKIIPYYGIKLGAITLVDESGRYSNSTKFGLGFNLGLKAMINDRFGLNLYSQLQSAVQGAGLYMGVGTGGVSTGVSTYSSALQLSFGGGLVFVLKK